MIRRTAGLVLLYLVGLLLVWGWSLSHLLGGTATRDNLALVLVLSLAGTAVSLYLPYLSKSLVDRALLGRDEAWAETEVAAFAEGLSRVG